MHIFTEDFIFVPIVLTDDLNNIIFNAVRLKKVIKICKSRFINFLTYFKKKLYWGIGFAIALVKLDNTAYCPN